MIKARDPVTKSPSVTKSTVTKQARVTEAAILFTETPDDPIGLLKEMVSRVGRPRVHPTAAAKQKAYRERRSQSGIL